MGGGGRGALKKSAYKGPDPLSDSVDDDDDDNDNDDDDDSDDGSFLADEDF